MKVRVADVCSSGLRWDFVPAETEEFTGESSQQINFPPATLLFSAAIEGDPSLKNIKPELLDVDPPPPALLEPHNSNGPADAPLASIEKMLPPLDTAAPDQQDDVPTPTAVATSTEETSVVPLLQGGLAVEETVAPSPEKLQLLHSHVQPTPPPEKKESVQGIPPGFEIEIQTRAAAGPAFQPQAQAPLVGANAGGGSGEAALSVGFDYFTATQISPATQQKGKNVDPSQAWAAGLPSPAMNGGGGGGLQLIPLRQFHSQQQQQEQQQQQITYKENNNLPAPLPSAARPGAPAAAQLQPPRRGGGGGGGGGGSFKLNPQEKEARILKVSALQEELSSILYGKGNEKETGNGPGPGPAALPLGFQPAAGVQDTNFSSKQPNPPFPARLSPSTEILTDDMADQLSALEAAAMAAKKEIEKENQKATSAPSGDASDSSGGRERKRSRSPEAESSIPPRACVGFLNGFGKAVTVDAVALAAAQRLFDSPDKEKEETENLDKGVPETEEKKEENSNDKPNKQENKRTLGGGGGFSTGLGKKVEIPAEQLAAAKRLLEDKDDDCNHGAAGSTTALLITPIRAQTTTMRTATATETAAAVPARRPSRLGPNGHAAAAHLTSAGVTKQQYTAQRKGRGKFNTPRPAAAPCTAPSTTKKPFATPVTGTGTGTAVANNDSTHEVTPYAITVPTTSHKSSTPLHDLKSSALKTARAQLLNGALGGPLGGYPGGPLDSTHMPLNTSSSSSISRWPDYLPLDSLAAADYVFKEPDGRSLRWQIFHQYLLTAGANKHYATEEWVQNAYRWVVWKLARAEFATGACSAGQILTSTVAEDELKLRYEREFNRGHRPLLKAVFNQDESAAALAVYMVASIRNITTENGAATTTKTTSGGGGGGGGGAGRWIPTTTTATTPTRMLELTDGWYWIMAQCDPILTTLIQSGKICPGSKIRIMGAELLAPGGPAEPLTAARSARLRLHANGVHPVPDSTKIGQAGISYPRLLWTKLPSGVATFQTPRAQAAAERTLQAELSKARANAAAQVQKQELARCKEWLIQGKSDGMMTQLDRWYATVVVNNGGAMLGGDYPGGGTAGSQGKGDFITSLNSKDRTALERYTAARHAELEEETHRATEAALAADLPAARNAGSTEAAMLLVGEVTHEGIGKGRDLALVKRNPAAALVTVWRPPEEFSTSLKEGEVFAVMGLEPRSNNNKSRLIGGGAGAAGAAGGIQSPLLLPDSVLQLEAPPRSCHWRKVACSLAQLPKTLAGQAMPRAEPTLAGMGAVAAAAAFESQRAGALFDFTGVVLNAGPVYQNLNNRVYSHYQWIFFADASLHIAAADGLDGEDKTAGMMNEQWLLAVQLVGPQDAVSWLEPGEVGTVVSLHDLELTSRDEGSRMWRAAGGKHSAVVVHSSSMGGADGERHSTRRVGHGRGPVVNDVVSWAKDNPETITALQVRVEALLKG
ncbi:hypothetical protein Ndes2526B_g00883 [Nannochloris sp. 'desiccata']